MNLRIISSVALGVALGLAFVIYSRFEVSASSDQDRELASRGQENAEQDSIGPLAPYESNLPHEDQHVRGTSGELSSTSTTEKQLGFEILGVSPEPDTAENALDLSKFASESRDREWAPFMEGRFLSEFAQSGVALVNWHVECRTSRCLVVLVWPQGSDFLAPVHERRRLRSGRS